ncbi:MAG: lipopolysaccharide biosynthesis protein [Clostridia bacterium]|nr:lipopolysaccharide biosynthesis protein [Clostridia bacterium]
MDAAGKNRSKYVKLARAIFVSGGALLLNALITLILAPLISETVGTEAYGFVTLAKNVASYAVIITSALNSFAARHIVIAYHKNDKREANVFFSSTVIGDMALGTGLFLIAIVGVLFLDRLLHVSPALVGDVKLLFLLVFLNFWLTTVSTAFSAAGHIRNKLDTVGAFKVLSYVCEAAVLILCYWLLPPQVHYVGWGLVVTALVIALGNMWLCRRYTPDLRPRLRDFSWQAIKRLVVDGVWTSLNSLGDNLNHGLDLLVCNLMLTPLSMGQLALSKTFYSVFGGMFILISSSFEPLYLKSYADGDKETLLGEFKLAMKLSGMLSNIFFAGFIALGMAFYRLWIPNEDIALIYTLTIINNLTTVPGGPMQPLYYIYVLTLRKKIPTLVTIAGGLLNVAGMYVLIRYTSLGIYAVVWTTAAVMAIINFGTNPLYMAHVLGLPWHTFYPNIIRNVISCGVLVAAFKGVMSLYTPSSWLGLALSVCALAVLGAGLHLLVVFQKDDWKRVMTMLKRRRAA